MQFCHDCGTIDFEISFGPAPVSKRNKAEIWILRLIPMVPSALYVFALNNATSAFPSKGISSMMDTLAEDGYGLVLPELVACSNAKRSNSSYVSCGPLFVAKFTVLTFSVFSFRTVRPLMAQIKARCSAPALVERAHLAVLNLARLSAGTQSFSAV